MASAQMRRPEEAAKAEIASSNPIQTFYVQGGHVGVEVQFFVEGPRGRVENFLRTYNDSHSPEHLSRLLRDFSDIIKYCKVDGQQVREPADVLRQVRSKIGAD